MEVEIFALCDAAADYGNGKLSLMGTFDMVPARQFPAVHPHCAIALRIRFQKVEEGDHRLRITVVDEDGKSVLPKLDACVSVRFPPNLRSVCANTALSINGMKFEKPGRYAIDLAIDGNQVRSLPLTVVKVDPKPRTKGSPAPE